MEEKMAELAVWLQEHEAQMIEDIGGLVGIESVADENGFAACCQAMEQMAGYAGRDGMETTRHEDYCISITMGSGEKERSPVSAFCDAGKERVSDRQGRTG